MLHGRKASEQDVFLLNIMFIAFEGGDGCGKSTQQKLLAESLRSRGIETLLCRDPGSTALGDSVRNILLHGNELKIDDRTEMFLFMAARSQMVEELIRPALAMGKAVLSDRFLISSFVYQGYAGGVPIDVLKTTGRIATAGIMPDLTIILDLPYEIGVRRIGSRAKPDRMEQKGEDYHRRVREGFLRYATEHAESCLVLDATETPQRLADHIREAVSQIVPGFGKFKPA